MFLSRLNEISGGCEKILPVSGSFVRSKFYRRPNNFTSMITGAMLTEITQRDLIKLIREFSPEKKRWFSDDTGQFSENSRVFNDNNNENNCDSLLVLS